MKLPTIQHPIFELTIPSTKKKIKVRPMLVKEEKILLMAKEGQAFNEIQLAIKQVVNNCILNADFDINGLTLFDIEYMFIRLRAISIDSKAKVAYKDGEDETVYDFEVDLNNIEVKFPEKIDKNIVMGTDSGILMKWPEARLYENEVFLTAENEEQIFEELVINCIEKYYEGDKVYPMNDIEGGKPKIKEFVDNLDIATFNKIREFFSNLPSVYHEITYTNSKGNERKIVMNSLSDFFTLA